MKLKESIKQFAKAAGSITVNVLDTSPMDVARGFKRKVLRAKNIYLTGRELYQQTKNIIDLAEAMEEMAAEQEKSKDKQNA